MNGEKELLTTIQVILLNRYDVQNGGIHNFYKQRSSKDDTVSKEKVEKNTIATEDKKSSNEKIMSHEEYEWLFEDIAANFKIKYYKLVASTLIIKNRTSV